MSKTPQLLSGDKAAIEEFLSRFDVSPCRLGFDLVC